jgi:hypothetical protein
MVMTAARAVDMPAGTSGAPRPQISVDEVFDFPEGVTYRLAIGNWAEYPGELFLRTEGLGECGAGGVTDSSRTWVWIYDAATMVGLSSNCGIDAPEALRYVTFSVGGGGCGLVACARTPPGHVVVELHDRLTDTIYRSNVLHDVPTAP